MKVYVTSDGSVFGISRVFETYYLSIPRQNNQALLHTSVRYARYADAAKYLEKNYRGEWVTLTFVTEKPTAVREVTL